MKKGIHPKSHEVTIKCASCGTTFTTLTTKEGKDQNIDVCSNCHPFYIGSKGAAISVKGRAEKLSAKFESGKQTAATKAVKAKPRVKASKQKTVENFGELEDTEK